ncbi:MAG: RagB/SusD family nutrient uptake outer membrane protein [Gemmatimonadota bacterium]
MHRLRSLGHAALAVALAFGLTGCETLLLEGASPVDRDRLAQTRPADIMNLVAGGFSDWYFSIQGETPSLALGTMAQAYTSSWGDFGMRRLSSIPRPPMPHAASDPGIGVVNQPWYLSYAALAAGNLALLAVRGGFPFPRAADARMIEAAAAFLQGASLSNVALLFDRGYIVTETADLSQPIPLSPREMVREAALARLDTAIALASRSSFQLPKEFLNTTGWTSSQLAQVASTLAARTLAYFPRNGAENDQVDWARVARYAARGVSFDVVIEGDNERWYDPYKTYTQAYDGWVRVGQRMVCELDPTLPCVYPSSGMLPPPRSPDRRLQTDFIYLPTVPFNPLRGRYHLSNVGHKRYRFHSFEDESGGGFGMMPFLLRAENDLLLAEALIRTGGSRVEAAQLINRSRVGRGGLPPLTGSENPATLLGAVLYERDIELLGSGAGVPFFDMRRTDRLVPGTARQFPVPAAEREGGAQAMYDIAVNDPLPAIVAELAARRGRGAGSGGPAWSIGQGRVFRIAAELKAAARKRIGIGRE